MDKRVERSAYEDELKSRDLKKVTEAEIFDAALVFGNQIAETTQKTLAMNLQQAIQKDGIEAAIQFCNLKAYPLVDSLERNFNVKIKRTSKRLRNYSNEPDSIEQQILEAYQYNTQEQLSLKDNIQKIGDEILLYNKPIMISSPLCLNCHGEEGTAISQATNSLIKQLYPTDSATSYKMNDLRGMWSIRIPQKELIKHAF